ncbi:hypothetical protein ES677_15065 [Bizionia gelidisalsuginis]|uniref:DUF1795 domain-containing protein n=1 Tax=Bizionia gelidisalsuginis TaxID=291188 RepID=A0ABY3M6R8_9FLAO|nr:hypothetical protein [Bizionia gelidisalsuginis]TYC07436.1 hypothetical protein ES677_15065 [Bizionia gelidisalsuginis]
MKKIILLIIMIIAVNSYGQTEKRIDSLSYAHMKIAVPENCQAKSEYELLDCDGITIQWIYLTAEMLKSVPSQFITQFSEQESIKKRTEFQLESYGSELNGYKFKMKNSNGISYRLIVYGTVNNQSLLINIGTDNDIKKTSDLSEFLQKLISVK